jgi:hypothetical protein
LLLQPAVIADVHRVAGMTSVNPATAAAFIKRPPEAFGKAGDGEYVKGTRDPGAISCGNVFRSLR